MDDIDLRLFTLPEIRNRRDQAERIAAAFAEAGQSDRAAWWSRRTNMYDREITRRFAPLTLDYTQEG